MALSGEPVGGRWLVVSGWWLVVGGSWLVVRGWWLVVRGWWFVVRAAREMRGTSSRFLQVVAT